MFLSKLRLVSVVIRKVAVKAPCSSPQYLPFLQANFRGAIGQACTFSTELNVNVEEEGEVVDTEALEEDYRAEIDDIKKQLAEKKRRIGSLVGKVVSTKCSKSVNVLVEHMKFFPKYNKSIQRRKKIMAHDENEIGREGDMVRIAMCRPHSKKKRHYLIDILK